MNALQDFEKKLGTIADAIRIRKGTTDKIPAQNIETEILTIEGGCGSGSITAICKVNSLTITNGTVNVIDDQTIELGV